MGTTLKFANHEKPAIPHRFRNAVLDDKTHPAIREAVLDYVENFELYYRKGFGLAFLGEPGTGKTHASVIIARTLADKGIPVRWEDTVSLINFLMDTKDFRNTQYFAKKSLIRTIPVLVLDDFGKLSSYQRAHELFFEILNARYNNQVPTIFTADFTDDVAQGISEAFSPAVFRRIEAMAEILISVD
jgi:DNA replication protein DnaC